MSDRENEFEIVQTCGLCEMVIPIENINIHPCLEGYSNYYVDNSTLYFYPMTDDGQNIIRKSSIGHDELAVLKATNNEENYNKENLSSNIERLKKKLPMATNFPEPKRKLKTCLSFDEEELLILEVQKREALWNFQLDVRQRNPKERNKLWQEVSDSLNGIISAETAKNKFKSLHDTYRKIIQSEQKTSGSARSNTTRLWQHYNNMEFLRDSCLVKTTASNIPRTRASFEESDQSSEETRNVRSEKKTGNVREKSAIERIANALCDTSNDDIILPPPPQPDDIDSFLNLLGSRIRRLSEVQKQEAFQRHLQLSYDMLKENST